MGPNTTAILKRGVPLSLAALLAGGLCVAQVEPWERVRLIEEGKSVAVTLHTGATVNGKMQVWRADGITVQRGEQVVALEKAQISRVELVTGMSRGRRALWVGAITGGIIGGLGVAACASGACEPSPGAVVGVSAALFGSTAAGIAALFPRHKERIYQAPPPAEAIDGIHLLYAESAAAKSGDRIRIRIQLAGSGGRNISSPGLSLRAAGISTALDAAAPVTPLSRDDNPDDSFRYDARLGGSGGYVFDLNTAGLAPGPYRLHFQAGNGAREFSASFRVK